MDFKKEILNLKAKDQFRVLNNLLHTNENYVVFNGKKCLNLSSNDYLGISQNQKLLKQFFESINFSKSNLLGSASSRLLSGNYNEYFELETLIAKLYEKESALVYNSGYHANTGILPALTTKNDLILSDKLNHASIVDGLKLSEAKNIRYKHLDYSQIELYLEKNRNNFENVFIVSESVFSMDGDIADLQQLIKIKNKFNCILYIDEAHAFGVFGKTGLGISEISGNIKDIDIIVGTFGKAIASVGAFVTLSKYLKEVLVNKSRTLIYTTGLPLINILWTKFILEQIVNFKNERENLQNLSEQLKRELINNKLVTLGASQIVPVIIGQNELTLKVSEELLNNGFYVSAVRPPTVPINTSRLRLSLNSQLNFHQLKIVVKIIAQKMKK
jgi:8-amino-7-oxononanoate synthase